MSSIECHDTASASLGAGDDGGIGESQPHVIITLHKVRDARKVGLSAVQGNNALVKVVEEWQQSERTKPLFHHVAKLAQDSGRDNRWTRFSSECPHGLVMVAIALNE